MTKTTNTLFRFATMRSPELLSEGPKERYFVYHPNPTGEGHFKTLVATPILDASARNLAWKNLAATYGALQSQAQVKTLLGDDFFDFTNWLSKNAKAVSEDESVIEDQPDYRDQQPLTHAKVITLWDNLFFQLITNKSSYVRDLVINALIANHYLNSAAVEDQSKTALSRVVVPQEFYGTVSLPGSNPPPTGPVYARDLQKQIDTVLAVERSQQIETAVNELKKAQDAYNKNNMALYNAAKDVYDEEMRQKQATQSDTGTPQVDLSPVDIAPRFSYTAPPEIEESFVSNYLSATTLAVVKSLDLFNQTSFETSFRLLSDELKKQADIGFAPEALSNRVININNVILPIEDPLTLPGQQYGFTMQVVPITNTLSKVVVAINMGYTNADAVYALYHAVTPAGTNTNGAFTDTPSGNTLVLQFYPNGFDTSSIVGSFRLHGEIRLANGVTLLFDTQLPLKAGTTGRMTVQGVETPGETEDYVPLGFGIKRLGIADYRKVESTTCCYVPGEVSHIENIMAREYKEKSTRRLRRSEETTTISKETEKEELTDTTSTNRYEMNQQVAEVINKDLSIGLGTSSKFSMGGLGETSLTSNFAFNTSSQHSNSQAVSIAKDVTERALERVVQKVREERILKIVEEFEEQNKHGFDNRKGDKHVSGVYRWIDKIYKNQVYNYGKRLMYEFMIPQPAVFHAEAMKNIGNGPVGQVLEKPVDPRTAGLVDYRNINEATAAKWAATYGAEIETLLDEYITWSKAIDMNVTDAPGHNYTGAKSHKMELPDGYETTGARLIATFQFHPDKDEWSHTNIRVADASISMWGYTGVSQFVTFGYPIRKELAISTEARDLGAISLNVMANCRRTAEEYRRWQISCFNEIIKGYEKKLAAYNDALAALQVDAGSKGTNPGFYRIIENTVLRKNCITYLVGKNNLGKKFYTGNTVDTILPDITSDMDRYSARAKFIEQAFEWDLISYNFYPFYWGDKSAWQNMYQAEVDDPLFRSFLQAGVARTVVTVRPGFEEAVMHYMATGQVWNGGQVPVIGDDLYLSIVEELKNPTFYVDDTWETRVPTTLTVIQAGSIGLNVQGLPCDCGDTDTGIVQNNAALEAPDEIILPDPSGDGGESPEGEDGG